MDMETFRQLKDAENERDKWKEIATKLTNNEVEGWESESEIMAKKALSLEFERDQWKAIANGTREDAEKWCNVAGIMHQYLVEGNPKGAVEAYEQAAW